MRNQSSMPKRMKSPAVHQTSCALTNLPAEIQNKIYKLVVVDSEDIHIPADHPHEPQEPALLRTCQQIRNVAAPIYYGANVFETYNSVSIFGFLRLMRKQGTLLKVRSIRLHDDAKAAHHENDHESMNEYGYKYNNCWLSDDSTGPSDRSSVICVPKSLARITRILGHLSREFTEAGMQGTVVRVQMAVWKKKEGALRYHEHDHTLSEWAWVAEADLVQYRTVANDMGRQITVRV